MLPVCLKEGMNNNHIKGKEEPTNTTSLLWKILIINIIRAFNYREI